mmetsp:Transcript_18267/g.43692  ORF Transcript_18267/g.43692 Transcript_18267/m.43692 type:complete len:149 (-) Transcript_18267:163-609(-)
MAALATAFSGLSLKGSVVVRRGQNISGSVPGLAAPSGRVAFFVDAKQNSLKRQRVTERNRLYNKDRKSEIATRIKKVIKAVDSLQKQEVQESDILGLEKMIGEATKSIDKAVSKGIMKQNTAARRKSRMSRAKRGLLIKAGMYTPAAK